jgi:peptidoglycan/LPS O-acetylase OafA/YrhL
VAILVLAMVILVSAFTYKYIEVKGQEYGRTLINKKAAGAEKAVV